MPTVPLTDPTNRHVLDQVAEAWRACEGERYRIKAAAERLGIPRSTFESRLRICEAEGLIDVDNPTPRPLARAGYQLASADLTPAEAWEAGRGVFERTAGQMMAKQWRIIRRDAGPGVIFHQTDVHVDDDGVPLDLIEADIAAARDMNAVMCHGGDLLNNWPMAGKLAKKWAEQACTRPAALLRAQHYLDLFKPDALVWGNHEEMNPYLTDLLDTYLPRGCITDHWSVNFVVKPKRGREVRCILSHKFQKGQSWFHRMHGHLREMLEGQEADLFLDGHLHCAGSIDHDLPERGISAVGVASGGYKLVDSFARRISKGGNSLKLRGRAHWIVYDTDAEDDEALCVAFKSPRQAEACLNGLQNLRTI